MKQNQIILIAICFLIVVLMATNPSTAEHKEAVKEKVSAAFENNNTDGNAFQKLGEQLGQTIGMVLIDKMIKRENYLLFSLTKSNYTNNDKKEKVVGFGILGKVYLFDKFSNNNTEKIEDSKNPIISKTIKIENIEVAEKDFSKEMSWNEAKKACESLGDGWRLPTNDEINILYQKKDDIGGFSNNKYWTADESGYDGSDFAWQLDFATGNGDGHSNKRSTYYVRAVRGL
jgi:hypothetical protein